MAKYPVGLLIASTRKKLGISQEELSYGVCSVSTLSKIENGVQMPTYKVYGALLERLGLSKKADLFVSEEDLQRSNLELKISCEIARGNCNVEDYLEEYRHCKKDMSQLEKQFYTYVCGIVQEKVKKDVKRALELYKEALLLSIPDFETGGLEKVRLFTLDEITIINNIANASYKVGNKKIAKKYMFFLKEYLEKEILDEEEKAKKYPVILFNLSNWMWADERYEKMLQLCEIGIDYCIEKGKLSAFPYLIFNRAYAYVLLNKKEEAIEYMKQSYYLFYSLKKYHYAEIVKKEMYDLFHMQV